MSNPNAAKSGKPQWALFFIISYILILGYLYLTNPGKDKKAQEEAAQKAHATQTTGTLTANSTGTLTAAGMAAADTETSAALQSADGNSSLTVQTHPGDLVNLRTKLYDIDIDSIGAVVHSWRLLDTGSQSFNPSENTSGVELIRQIPTPNGGPAQQNWPLEIYMKEHGVHSYEDFNHVTWTEEKLDTKGQSAILMKSPAIRGLRIDKSFDVPTDDYYSTFRITVTNDSNDQIPITDEFGRGLTLRWGPGLVERDLADPDTSANRYDNAVVRDFKDVQVYRPKADGEVLESEGQLQWAGVESKFFAALLVPQQPDDAAHRQHYHFRTLVPNSYKVNAAAAVDPARRADLERYTAPLVMELSTAKFDIAPHSSRTFEFGIYVGPKKHSILKKYDHDLQSIMYSESWWWMRAIYLALTDLLNWIHRVIVSNYGIAIMLLTVVVKLIVFPLVHRSIKIQGKSSAEMKRVKPHLEAINEKYKDNAQEKQRQTWKVYQEHGINPLGAMRSCLPVLPQVPIFIGLYRIANDTIDLQGAHFLWIKDLSQADHFMHLGSTFPLIGSYLNLLPFMVAVTQIFSSKISMSRSIQNITDENQKQMQKMMVYLIPVMVLFTMYHFPSGLMLYWIASNTWQIGQTLITNRILDHEEEKHLKAGPPPRKAKKAANPNSFMGKLMARAETARQEMERREAAGKKSGSSSKKKR